MAIVAGTSRGVFKLSDGAQAQSQDHDMVLECRGVKELSMIEISGIECLFAATSQGLFVAEMVDGDSWRPAGLNDCNIWQLQAAGDGNLFAVTQPAGLFRSVDAGNTWQPVESFVQAPEAQQWCVPVDPPQPGRARTMIVDRNNPDRLWVGVEVGGIMCSDDGGANWRLNLPGDNPDIHVLVAHPVQPDVLFVSTGYGRLDGVAAMVEGNAGVFRSEDGGLTWEYAWRGVTPRYSRPMCIDPRPPYPLTVAAAPHAFSSFKDQGGAQAVLFRSDDQGDNWYSLGDSDHAPSAANFHGLAPDPQTAGGVLVGTDNGEVWRVSADAQWQLLASGLPAVLSVIAW